MSDVLTMMLVLGGTFVAGAALFYFSLKPDTRQLRSPQAKRNRAVETTAILAAAQDTPGSSPSSSKAD